MDVLKMFARRVSLAHCVPFVLKGYTWVWASDQLQHQLVASQEVGVRQSFHACVSSYVYHFIEKMSFPESLTCPSQADFTLCVMFKVLFSCHLATNKC